MDVSPFPYQGPLLPEQVEVRTELVADLIERVSERRVTALIGPRRFGKTTVLRKVAADVIAASTTVVWVDLYEVSSMADLTIRLDESLARITGRGSELIRSLAAAASLNLGLVRVDLKGPAASRPDPVALLHTQFDVLTTLAERTGVLFVVDEFSSIDRVDGAAGLMRTHLQHHFQQMGIVFAGSEPSMMTTLFTDEAQPFYAQADLVEIDPFTDEEVVAVVQSGFRRTKRKAGPLPSHIAALANGHPQRTMQLADTCWRLVDVGDEATFETWEHGLDRTRSAVSNGLERLYSGMQSGEKDVLRVTANGGSIFGASADLLDLANGTARNAANRLLDRGHLRRDGKRYALVDPLFADWIRTRMPI